MHGQFRKFHSNGINIRAHDDGEGPLIVMVHGWPESWYSWRHQIPVLVDAGYRVLVPDVRGYGGSDKPEAVAAYDMVELTRDVIGLIDALGEEQAILIGHDWGAPICWNTAALYPDRIRAVAGLSVPHVPRMPVPAVDLWRQIYAGRFFYQLYFQQEGVAEAELEADIRKSLRQIYYRWSGEGVIAARGLPEQTAHSRLLDGWIDPDPLPDWLSEDDLDYYTAAFEESGFRGPLNRYRAQSRDWELLPELSELKIIPPSYFIGGELDMVRYFVPGGDLFEAPGESCTDFRGKAIIPGVGHWVQQEAPEQVSRELLKFLSELGN